MKEPTREELIDTVQKLLCLVEAWRSGILKKIGIVWVEDPPAIIMAKTVLAKVYNCDSSPTN
jgi:hypothetical protein